MSFDSTDYQGRKFFVRALVSDELWRRVSVRHWLQELEALPIYLYSEAETLDNFLENIKIKVVPTPVAAIRAIIYVVVTKFWGLPF